MKTTVALVFALLALVPPAATATPLTITSGTIEINGPHGMHAFFSGDSFSVFAMQEPYSWTPIQLAFGVDPYVTVVGLGTVAEVSVGGQLECRARQFELSCGNIWLTSPGFAMPADWPIGIPFVATVPFTAVGFLLPHYTFPPFVSPGGTRYDLVGSGTVTGTCLNRPQQSCFTSFSEDSSLVYRFTVGEPPTFLLTLAFAIAVVGIMFVHRRAAVNT